ncbi:hypothetical protein LTR17_021015 [Elasticomyces elasticus]|nr:hypothetical protein LTR17_021015 [Elasticomyces elasticus]
MVSPSKVAASASKNQTTSSLAEYCAADSTLSQYRDARMRAEQEQELLRAMCGRPSELIICIFEKLVAAKLFGDLLLQDRDTLPTTARSLLGSQAPDFLQATMQDTILETVNVRFQVRLERIVAGTASPKFPDFTTSLVHKIRTLLLYVDVDIRSQYPAPLSLRGQLPQLHVLRLCLRFNGTATVKGNMLAHTCSAGYNGKTTYRELLERLVTAMQSVKPGRQQYLAVDLHKETNGSGTTALRTPIDGRPASEIVGGWRPWV